MKHLSRRRDVSARKTSVRHQSENVFQKCQLLIVARHRDAFAYTQRSRSVGDMFSPSSLYRVKVHSILTVCLILAAATRKLDGADTRAHMVGTLACNAWQIPLSVLELRHAASVADNWFRARRIRPPTRERCPYTRKRAYETGIEKFSPVELSTALVEHGSPGEREKDTSGQPLLRPELDRPLPEGSDWENYLVVSFDEKRREKLSNEYRVPVLR